MIDNNLKFIRKQQNLTQQKFSDLIGIKRSSLGAYEEGRANPSHETLIVISDKFGISIDRLLKEDLAQTAGKIVFGSKSDENRKPAPPKVAKQQAPPLAITVDREGKENIELIPHKVEAGYLKGYADLDYIKTLPKFRLPFLPEATYRAFEIDGDSMLPLPSGSIVIGEYVDDLKNMKDGEAYVVVSENGIAYKRVYNRVAQTGSLLLRSDNTEYPEYAIVAQDVLELWQAKLFICKELPQTPDSLPNLAAMSAAILELQNEVRKLKGKS